MLGTSHSKEAFNVYVFAFSLRHSVAMTANNLANRIYALQNWVVGGSRWEQHVDTGLSNVDE